jgi:multisubunit Na+/H+ antiporter MnhB subunit
MLLQPLRAGELMKALQSVGVGLASLLATGSTLAQNEPMMNDGMRDSRWMGGYGGYWVPILALAVVVGLVVWVVKQQKK